MINLKLIAKSTKKYPPPAYHYLRHVIITWSRPTKPNGSDQNRFGNTSFSCDVNERWFYSIQYL